MNHFVEPLQKVNGFEVFTAAKLVGYPLAFLARIIKV
jgi:hypothetical protein